MVSSFINALHNCISILVGVFLKNYIFHRGGRRPRQMSESRHRRWKYSDFPETLTFLGGIIFDMKSRLDMIPFDFVLKVNFDRDFIFKTMPKKKVSMSGELRKGEGAIRRIGRTRWSFSVSLMVLFADTRQSERSCPQQQQLYGVCYLL